MPTIVGIADTHMAHEQVKPIPGDILVVAGDFMGHGYVKELAVFNKWLGTLPHRHKIVVAGNHDWACQEEAAHLIKGIFTNAIYLNMEATTVMGIKFFGCPWTPEFFDWAFMYPRDGQMGRDIWAQVPEDTNVLVTHGPPAGTTLGLTKDHMDRMGQDAGCRLLTERILQLPNLKATFHGHIHPGAGIDVIQERVTCHNVAVVDEYYQVKHHGLKYEYK
jgi:3',5'-cyclic AMP phosphodiesterase CpdA